MVFTLIRGLLLLVAGLFPVFRVGVESLGFGSIVLIIFWFAYAFLFLAEVIKRHKDFQSTVNNSVLSFASLVAAFVLIVETTVLQGNQLFQITLAVWALVTGLSELWLGLSKKISNHKFMGVLTLVLGGAILIVPADYFLEFVPEKAPPGWLDAPTMHIGLFGVYAVTAGVYLVIAALSKKYGSSNNG